MNMNMTTIDKAVRELMDALLILKPKLEEVNINKSIDDNVDSTGLDERFVKAYMLGMKVTK